MQGMAPWQVARRLFAVVFAFFMLFPIAVVLIASFTGESYVRFPPQEYGLRWYVAAIEDSTFMQALLYSVEIAIVVALISGVLGVSSAIALSRAEGRTAQALSSLIMMPLALPHIVIAIALLQLFSLVALPLAPWGLIAGHMIVTAPFVVRLTMTSLTDLNRQLELSSYSLGASPWQTFRYVTLPLIAPGVAAGVVFAFLLSFDEVTISLFLALPGQTPLPAELFNYASQGDDPVITAVSGLMIILTALLLLVVERMFGVLRLIASEQPTAA
jgi:putative spermidine/putrescine transport system permease protein